MTRKEYDALKNDSIHKFGLFLLAEEQLAKHSASNELKDSAHYINRTHAEFEWRKAHTAWHEGLIEYSKNPEE